MTHVQVASILRVKRNTTHPDKLPREVFSAALQISHPAERAAFLDAACDGQPMLRQRMEELLAEQAQLGDFLDSPALATPNPSDGAGARLSGRRGGSSFVEVESVGARIGRYRLKELIGEGGCGTVYCAEQEEPVRREVALKVIKAGMDTRAVIARFEAERQALARMDHPNIAKVFDAGTTEHGRPYFVMELVKGVRVTEYCDRNNLSTPERLDLFILVCRAIQHAHQRGIIHRDIKPSNILVSSHDGTSVPKVIDFGIAKAIEQPLTEKTLVTAVEQLIGTPAYMSPEQAETSGLDIDTRTDVYSLGVLLYEMLTSKTPFDGKQLLESGLEAMRRTLREKEPPWPSTCLRSLNMAEAAEVVRHRREKMASLLKSVRGDLDWIVMKAVAKDRTRRYDSASSLARDVERYLTGQAVTARPPSRTYLLQKFVQRNKLLVAGSAAMLVVLLMATAVSTWQAVRATKAERDRAFLLRVAETARQREVQQRRQAELQRAAALRRAYNSDMNLVPQALLANNYGRVLDLIDRQRPKASSTSFLKTEPERDFRQWEWRYYWNQARSQAAFAFPRQSNSVVQLSLSPDNRYLATRDRRGAVKLWDWPGRTEIASLRSERAGDGPFAFSRKSDRIIVASSEGPQRNVLQVWSLPDLKILRQTAVRLRVQALAVSTADDQLIFLGDDGQIGTWDLSSDAPNVPEDAGEFPPRRPRISLGCISPDAKWVAMSQGDRIRVTDVMTGREALNVIAFDRGNACLAFSPDGRILAVSPSFTEVETSIKLFDVSAGKELGELVGHASWIPGLSFSPDGKRLISAGADQTIRVWDLTARRELAVLRGHRSEVNCAHVAADGLTLMSGCKDGSLFGWNVQATEPQRRYQLIQGPIVDFQFFPRTEKILAVDSVGVVRQWDPVNGREIESLSSLGTKAERVAISPDETRVYIALKGGRLAVLDWPARRVITNVIMAATGRGQVVPVGVIHGGRTLVTYGPEGVLRVWDTASWSDNVIGNSRVGLGWFGLKPAIGLGESYLAVAGPGNVLEVRDLVNGEIRSTINQEGWGFGQSSFSPDGRYLALASREGTVALWGLASQRVEDVLRGHLLGVHDVAFSPDSQRLASVSAKNEAVKLWDVDSRHEVATLGGEGSIFTRVAFSPEGTLLAAENIQGQVHIWQAPPLQDIDALDPVHQ